MRTMEIERLNNSLEREKHAVALWIGFLGHIDLAVDHGHDTIAKLWGTTLADLHTYSCTKYLFVNNRLGSRRI